MACLKIGVAFLVLCVISAAAVDMVGNRVVHLQRKLRDWNTALQRCKSQGMQLLTILTLQDHHDTIALMRKHGILMHWLAATDFGHEGDFVWATTGQKVTNTYWKTGNPNNLLNLEHCVIYQFEHLWDDFNCEVPLLYFCEEIPTPSTTLTPTEI